MSPTPAPALSVAWAIAAPTKAARPTNGDTMTMAARTDPQSPAPHVADSHDLIRVHGARENNLKDVSIEIPKRRLTVFTGVSGSGKSSLVFETSARAPATMAAGSCSRARPPTSSPPAPPSPASTSWPISAPDRSGIEKRASPSGN